MSIEGLPRLCSACGRPLESDFAYCPRCGRPAEGGSDFQELLDGSFGRLAATEASRSVRRLEDLEGRLRDLEAELEDLVVHAEDAAATRR